ncbi:DUF397 domain-containing protein [Streptomyces prasinus]|uniref:DUF397 domain-containing protein n=1 Tax=Streptomyces prasinus TaxID=67345 RepID=UPI00363D9EB3
MGRPGVPPPHHRAPAPAPGGPGHRGGQPGSLVGVPPPLLRTTVTPACFKSSRSGSGNDCVGVAIPPGADAVLVPGTARTPGGRLTLVPAAWADFRRARAGGDAGASIAFPVAAEPLSTGGSFLILLVAHAHRRGPDVARKNTAAGGPVHAREVCEDA